VADKRLSLFDATLLVMGGIIGVGIFFTPSTVAARAPDPTAFLVLWAAGCGIAMIGALTFAELGATFPRDGGWYVFLREAWGPFVAFLFAWVVLFVVSTGATAVMMSFFTDVVRDLLRNGPSGADVAAGSASTVSSVVGPAGSASCVALGAAVIVLMTALTMCGVKIGATFQNVCMIVKLAAIAAMVFAGFALFQSGSAPVVAPPAAPEGGIARGMLAAILPVLFSCGGWQMVCYIAPQVRDPQKTLPRAIVLGVLGVAVVYLSINAAYLRVIGIGGLAADRGFASVMAERTLGGGGATLLRVAMAFSALGVCAVTIIATPWMYVAMAREGLFFARFAKLNARTGAPILALVVQCALCLAYWFWGEAGAARLAELPKDSAEAKSLVTPDVLTSAVVYIEWVFHALVAVALLRLRARRPELPRPFTSPLYPLAPVLYLLFAIAVVCGNLVQANVRDTAIGLSLLAVGALVYTPWRALVARSSRAARTSAA
jgi:APA family basic amino acid/polyamine antiporter